MPMRDEWERGRNRWQNERDWDVEDREDQGYGSQRNEEPNRERWSSPERYGRRIVLYRAIRGKRG